MSKAAKPQKRHFIVGGRKPGDDEDLTVHVVCNPGEDPWVKFVETVLYAGDDSLPSNWQDDDEWDDEWVYGGPVIEISGPPLAFEYIP